MNKKLLLGLGAFVILLVVVAVVKGGSRTLPQVSTEEIARRSIVAVSYTHLTLPTT